MKRLAMILVLAISHHAQSGGGFLIESSSVGTGGDTSSARFSLTATAGQTLSGGNPRGGQLFVQDGFWSFELVPTAAFVTLGGRVSTADGRGIRNAVVTLTAPNGDQRAVLTGSFGNYRFENVSAGSTYVISVSSKRFVFSNPMLTVPAVEEVNDLDFVAADL